MPRDVRAMVLTAGLGTRLRPLTDHLPKPLVPLLGIPLLDITLERLRAAGVSRAVFNLHYLVTLMKRRHLTEFTQIKTSMGLIRQILVNYARRMNPDLLHVRLLALLKY